MKLDVFQIVLIGLMSLTVPCHQFDISKNRDNCVIAEENLVCMYKSIGKITTEIHQYYSDDSFTFNHVEVNCTAVNPAVYDILNNLNFNESREVKFINCALPVKTSFGQGMPQLNELTIHNDNYHAIGPFERIHFGGLTELTKLTIMTNATHEVALANGIFDEILNLENVTIGYYLKSLNTDVFAKHSNLRSLGLIGNHFYSLTKRSFQGVSQIEEIRLVSNNIQTIDSDAFEHIINLDNVLISGNRIPSLPNGLFANNSNLRFFEMFCDGIEMLPDELFKRLPKLIKIVVRCNMTSVSENLFTDSHDLRSDLNVIDLSFNALTAVPPRLFKNLRNLRFVNLNNNLLTTLPDLLFEDIYLTEELNLSNNRFKTINDLKWYGAYYINLSFNLITDLHIDLSNFFTIRTELDSLYHSGKVNFSHNLITEVSVSDVNNVGYFTKFFLTGNPFNCSCEKISPIMELISQNMLNELKCATPAYMEGKDANRIQFKDLICTYPTPPGCNVSTDEESRIMTINCTNAKLTKVPTLPTSKEFYFYTLELYIDYNAITELPKLNTTDFTHLTKIIARNNSIKQISSENIPTGLKLLDLSNNRLRNISRTSATMLSSVKNISFGGNSWSCNCGESDATVLQSVNGINDWEDIKCENGQQAMEYVEGCVTSTELLLFITISITFLIATFFTVVYYRNKEAIFVWLYAYNLCLCCISEDYLDRDKDYDVFLSVAYQNDDFVLNHLLPQLESGPNPYRICFHARDWIPGDFIYQQVINSVENSCRTIIVLSSNYLESVWGKMEFRAAHASAMRDGRPRLIVILYEDVADVPNLDPEIEAYLKTNTYLKWGDPRFFDKLRYALPHRRRLNLRGDGRPQGRVHHNEVALSEMQQNLTMGTGDVTYGATFSNQAEL